MSKNIRHQAIFAISECFKPGIDKHSLKEETKSGKLALPETHHVFSYAQKDALTDLASQAMRYIRAQHPDIKWIRNVKAEHFNEFMESKAATCTTATLNGYASRIRKLEECVNHRYNLKVDWHTSLKVPSSAKTPEKERVRTQQMERADFEKIIAHAQTPGKTSLAPIAWELTVRFGLRVSGAAKIKAKNVHLDRPGKWGFGQISIVEKGGRHRTIDIMTAADREYISKLATGKKADDLLVGISKDSINKALNRNMTQLGLKEKYPETGEHSLRKLYAQDCWNHCRANGMDRKEAIRYVNQQLGHGRDRDSRLLAIYVRSMI